MSYAMPPFSRPLAALLAGVLLAAGLTACEASTASGGAEVSGRTTPSPAPNRSAPVLPGPTGSGGTATPRPTAAAPFASLAEFVAALAAAGVSVRPDPGGTGSGDGLAAPPATDPGPVALSAWQARAAFAETSGGGMSGFELDELVRLEPFAPGAQPLPVPLLVAAWAGAGRSPEARMADRLLGDRDWSRWPAHAFPSAVLLLFAADSAGDAAPTPPTGSTRAAGPSQTPPSAAAGVAPAQGGGDTGQTAGVAVAAAAHTPALPVAAGAAAGTAAASAPPAIPAKATAAAILPPHPEALSSALSAAVPPAVLPAAVSPCAAYQELVIGTIKAFFAAIPRLSFKVFTGNLLKDTVILLNNIGAVLENFGLDAIQTLVIGGVDVVAAPVLRSIQAVATVLAIAGSVLTTARPWTAVLTAAPGIVAMTETAQPVAVDLTVTVPGPREWPRFVEDCARLSGVTLPSLTPGGEPVTWRILRQEPQAFVTIRTEGATLSKQGTARLQLEAMAEPPDLARDGESRFDGSVVLESTVHRRDLDRLADLLTDSLTSMLPAALSVLRGQLHRFLEPKVAALTEPLRRLADVSARLSLPVNYHVPDPQRTPKPAPPAPVAKLKPGTCPSSGVVGHRYSLFYSGPDLLKRPGLCVYELPTRGSYQLHIQILPWEAGFAAALTKEPVALTGALAAAVNSGCSTYGPLDCWIVEARAGDAFLHLVGAPSRAVAVDIATRVLRTGLPR